MKRCARFAAATSVLSARPNPSVCAEEKNDSGLTVYFGDLHNHNAVGYGLGSPERAFDIARSHLDFFCFTPHAYHDTSAQGILMSTWQGFEKITHDRWPDVLELNRQYNKPGSFVTFPGYERHSSSVGHYHIIFPFDDPPLEYFDKFTDFQNHAREHGAIIVPHHPGYKEGTAGAVPRFWDKRVSPLVEIYSEHGNAESDTASLDYVRHSMGPRLTRHTMQSFLEQGYRFGIVASTDNHLGFPGAYGEGKAAVLAPELTREAIYDALKRRHTYGVTGDKIEVDFRVNGAIMGEGIPYNRKRSIYASVKGWNWIDRIEVLKNNRVIHREFPSDFQAADNLWNRLVIVRIEYGWGPMSTNQVPLTRIPEIYDWDMTADFEGARIMSLQPCWQGSPFDEKRRHRITHRNDYGFTLTSATSRRRALFQCDTQAVVMKVQGSPRDKLTVTLRKPGEDRLSVSLADLLAADETVKLKTNSLKIHRLVPDINASATFSFTDEDAGDRADWYYLRVIQKNGHLAWSSPVWVEKRG